MSFHKFIPQIEAARLAGEKTLRAAGLEPEPAEVTYAVEAHRWFWKPQTTRWLFIADSTVFTSAADLTAPEWQLCRQAIIPEFAAPETIPPKEYIGHIYCPGFGEIQIPNHVEAFRSDVIQEFHHSFGFYLDGDLPLQQVPEVGPPDIEVLNQRVKGRYGRIQRASAQEIWLLDTSVHATHRGVGKGLPEGQCRLPEELVCELQNQWWINYGKPLIDFLCESEGQEPSVWVVGESLHQRLTQRQHPLLELRYADEHPIVKVRDADRRWMGKNAPGGNAREFGRELLVNALGE